jgi:hypothetical protein
MDYFEKRKRLEEIFHSFWETIVPRFFPEVKDDDEFADYLLNDLLEELKEKYASKDEKFAGRKEWEETN